MPPKPLACPYCRTWFEASGRSIRCPSCSRRFSADAGALGSSGQAPIDQLPQHRWSYNPEAGDQARDHESLQPALTIESERVATEESYGSEPMAEEPGPGPIDVGRAGRPNLSLLFTIAFLAFFVLGPRFLEGNAFLAVLVVLLVARWLYGRWSRTPAPQAEPYR